MKTTILAIIAFLFTSAAFAQPTTPRSVPIPGAWWNTLESVKGKCGRIELSEPLTPDKVKNENGAYSIMLGGAWTDVSPDAVVKADNPYKNSLLWTVPNTQTILCFLP
jgi:hypothetical protein